MQMTLATEWGVGQVLWSMIWFTLFFLWIWLLIGVFADIFRSRDLGGGAKALWTIFVIVAPFLGVFVYLIARGGKMHERIERDRQAQDQAFRSYVKDAASPDTSADQLAKLADLKNQGILSEAEFQTEKAK